MTVGLASVVLVFGCSTAASSPSEGEATTGTTFEFRGSDLARESYERMAAYSSMHVRSTSTWEVAGGCSNVNPLIVESRTTPEGDGWVDLGGDGSIDAFRDGDRILVSAANLPSEWGVTTPWLDIPAEAGSRPLQLAVGTGPLQFVTPLARWPRESSAGIIWQFEELAAGPTERHETESVNGHDATRYRIPLAEEDVPGDVYADVWVADDGTIWKLHAEFDQETRTSQIAEMIDFDQPVDVEVDVHDPARFVDLPLAPVAAYQGTTECGSATDQATVSSSSCVDPTLTVADLAEGRIDFGDIACP